MRVLVVVGDLYTNHHLLWRACRTAGVDVEVLGAMHQGHSLVKTVTHPEVPIQALTPMVRSPRGHLWYWYRGLRAIILQSKPDIVHLAMEPWALPVVQSLSMRRAMRPAICVHGAEIILDQGSLLERAVRRSVLRWALPRLSGYVGWSTLAVQALQDANLPPEVPTAVVPAIVADPDRFVVPSTQEVAQARERYDLPNDGRVIVGYVGKVVHQKGVMDLIDAFERLQDVPAYLAIWGQGSLARGLQDRLGVHGKYVGPVPSEEVPWAMKAADVLVVPSRRSPSQAEQFGRVALEGMLCGRPVVAYATGALPEVVGSGGVLIEEGDLKQLSAAVQRLVEDRGERLRIGTAARVRAEERFAPKLLAAKLIRLWSDISGN